MKFIVLFEDHAGVGADLWCPHMPEHLAFLERHASVIIAAGPLKTGAGEGAGGLWLAESQDVAAVERLVHEDPLWPTGLRKSYRILVWAQVFADGHSLLA